MITSFYGESLGESDIVDLKGAINPVVLYSLQQPLFVLLQKKKYLNLRSIRTKGQTGWKISQIILIFRSFATMFKQGIVLCLATIITISYGLDGLRK